MQEKLGSKIDFSGLQRWNLHEHTTPKQSQMYSNQEKEIRFEGDLSQLPLEKWPSLTSFKFPEDCSRELATFFLSNLDSLVNLRKLDLSGSFYLRPNKQGPLLVSKISVLLKLDFLNISNCCLQVLPSSLFELENLKVLNCSDNDLNSLPSDLELLQNLEKFRCYSCGLQELPSSLCELKNLKILDCSRNQLKSLPSDFGLLQNLEVFYCNNNQLSSLPFSLGNLSKLDRFRCNDNNLSSFPFSLGNLSPNLEILYTINPLLPEIPEKDWKTLRIYLKEKAVEKFQNTRVKFAGKTGIQN